MYYNYNEFDNYYDTSKADDIFNEAMEKFKEILKEDLKENLKSTQEENERLKKENEELKNKSKDIRNREIELEFLEKSLKSKSEWKFYEEKFSELLKPLEEQIDMWYVESVSELVPKCDKCNYDREIDYVSATGKIIKGDCDCNKYQRVYKVMHTEINQLNFYKSSRDRRFIMTPKYEGKDYDDTYFKLKIQKLEQKFDVNNVSEYSYYGGYGGFTGFATKEECQKYCDWLVSQKESE